MTNKLTNIELSKTLSLLASFYETAPEGIEQPNLAIFCWSKESLQKTIRDIGGKWTKSYEGDWLAVASSSFPGVIIRSTRDSVCRKIVTYDCEPILSPAEESELFGEPQPVAEILDAAEELQA